MIKVNKKLKENKDVILQYCTNAQILELLKQRLSENEYLSFVKNNVEKSKLEIVDSLEQYLEINISKHELLRLIQEFNNDIHDDIINEITNNLIIEKGDL